MSELVLASYFCLVQSTLERMAKVVGAGTCSKQQDPRHQEAEPTSAPEPWRGVVYVKDPTNFRGAGSATQQISTERRVSWTCCKFPHSGVGGYAIFREAGFRKTARGAEFFREAGRGEYIREAGYPTIFRAAGWGGNCRRRGPTLPNLISAADRASLNTPDHSIPLSVIALPPVASHPAPLLRHHHQTHDRVSHDRVSHDRVPASKHRHVAFASTPYHKPETCAAPSQRSLDAIPPTPPHHRCRIALHKLPRPSAPRHPENAIDPTLSRKHERSTPNAHFCKKCVPGVANDGEGLALRAQNADTGHRRVTCFPRTHAASASHERQPRHDFALTSTRRCIHYSAVYTVTPQRTQPRLFATMLYRTHILQSTQRLSCVISFGPRTWSTYHHTRVSTCVSFQTSADASVYSSLNASTTTPSHPRLLTRHLRSHNHERGIVFIQGYCPPLPLKPAQVPQASNAASTPTSATLQTGVCVYLTPAYIPARTLFSRATSPRRPDDGCRSPSHFVHTVARLHNHSRQPQQQCSLSTMFIDTSSRVQLLKTMYYSSNPTFLFLL
ncbi:hypothetical protein K438DRAFT_1978183 [Mycena galopus ATCC 62051]|nr:hypothetical protein K438DRAFT_1978183 [Mycena galopus ATCC 62051]